MPIYLVHYCVDYEPCSRLEFFTDRAEAEKAMTNLGGSDFSELIEWSGGAEWDYKFLAKFTSDEGME